MIDSLFQMDERGDRSHRSSSSSKKYKQNLVVFFCYSDFLWAKTMTDSTKVFNIYSTEPTSDLPEDNLTVEEVKRANASKSN